jgi:hypothetical protein
MTTTIKNIFHDYTLCLLTCRALKLTNLGFFTMDFLKCQQRRGFTTFDVACASPNIANGLVDLAFSPAVSRWEEFASERQTMVNSLHHNGCYFFFMRFDVSHLCGFNYFLQTGKPNNRQALNSVGQLDIDYCGLMTDLFANLGRLTNPEFAYLGITRVDFDHYSGNKIILPKNLYINVVFAVRSLLGNSDRKVGEYIAQTLCELNF